jgi:hypothetical protein
MSFAGRLSKHLCLTRAGPQIKQALFDYNEETRIMHQFAGVEWRGAEKLDGLGCTAPTSTMFIANLSVRVQVRHFRKQLPACDPHKWRHVYACRTEMAAAALDDVADRASNNPLWYTLSLDVGLDQSKDREKLRAIFDQGLAKAPKYRPLYRRMLRILMPRWGGSYDDVDKFINQIYAQTANVRGYERYAELYSTYARMEGDELDLFSDTHAYLNDWSSVKVIEKYGAQIDGRLTLTGEMTFKFRNGVYVDTHDGKVYRYGIVAVQ